MCTHAGGPGSRKGCIVDDLIMAYDLKHICTEQILHTELPKKLAGVTKIENVNGVKEVLEVRNLYPKWKTEKKIDSFCLPKTVTEIQQMHTNRNKTAKHAQRQK